MAAVVAACVWLAGQSPSSAPFVWLVPGGFALAFAASAACAVPLGRLRRAPPAPSRSAACAVPLGRLRRVTTSGGAGLGALAYLCYAVPLNVYVSANPRVAFHVALSAAGGRVSPAIFLGFAVLVAQIAFWLASLAGVAVAALLGILGISMVQAGPSDPAGLAESAEGTPQPRRP